MRKPFESLDVDHTVQNGFRRYVRYVKKDRVDAAIEQDRTHFRIAEAEIARLRSENQGCSTDLMGAENQIRELRAELASAKEENEKLRASKFFYGGRRAGKTTANRIVELEAQLAAAVGVIEECAERLSADSQALFENDMKYSAEAAESSAEKARQFLASLKEEK